MYSSTIQVLDQLYSKVSPGGFIIVDDYSIYNCRQAIEDFRAAHNIQSPIHTVDWTGVYWRKEIK
jgi:O-methyltransferase